MSANAADYPIKVDCPGWSADSAGQVEARVRTTLLVEGLEARQVGITCNPDGTISVSVVSEHGERQVPVERRAERVEDDVIATVEIALRQLLPGETEPPVATPDEPPPTPPPAAPTPAPVLPTPAPPAAPSAPRPPAPAPRTRNVTELLLAPAGELWSSSAAWGGDLGMSAGSERVRFGVALGGRTLVSQPSSVSVQEWGASARLALALPEPSGLRFTLGLGVSLLAASPAAHITAASSTLRGVASLEANVSRPFWFGAWGLSPELAARFFSGRRRVTVDESELVAVPAVAPKLAFSLIYRLE